MRQLFVEKKIDSIEDLYRLRREHDISDNYVGAAVGVMLLDDIIRAYSLEHKIWREKDLLFVDFLPKTAEMLHFVLEISSATVTEGELWNRLLLQHILAVVGCDFVRDGHYLVYGGFPVLFSQVFVKSGEAFVHVSLYTDVVVSVGLDKEVGFQLPAKDVALDVLNRFAEEYVSLTKTEFCAGF